jgi:hypothetical protein
MYKYVVYMLYTIINRVAENILILYDCIRF